MSDDRFLDLDPATGELIRRIPITVSAGTDDSFKLARTRYDGKFDPSLIPSTGGPAADIATFQVGLNPLAAFRVVALIDEVLVSASALTTAHAGHVVGITLEAGAADAFISVQLGG